MTPPILRRAVLAVHAAALLAVGVASAAVDSPQRSQIALGRDLFEGHADLSGRIRTHPANLPPAAIRCRNCHAIASGPDVPRSLAPRLTHELLLAAHARRGGPASIYDRNRFCTLLRDGLDPARVLISVEMPVYNVDDGQCLALWRFITVGAYEANER